MSNTGSAVAWRIAAAYGAIVLECTNMPPYAAAIRQATALPVFDITSLIQMVHAALVPLEYPES